MKEFLCETQELAIGYGKTPLASGIALGANPGQILVLVGPNGAGKSTLLKTLAGQLVPLGGTVLLDGHSQQGNDESRNDSGDNTFFGRNSRSDTESNSQRKRHDTYDNAGHQVRHKRFFRIIL